MRSISKRLSVVVAGVSFLASGWATAQDTSNKIPPHKDAIVLFDGKDLSNFDTFLQIERPQLRSQSRLSGRERRRPRLLAKEYGYIVTKVPYHDYYLRAEFKWGEGTYMDRAGKARDSGILYDIQGEQKVWPRSVEFQIQEGCTGDFWLTDGAAITGKDGKRVTGPPGAALKIDRFDKGPWANVAGFRDAANELEKPHGEWNVLELVTHGNDVKQYVNGKLANEGTDPFPTEGKILFQSEGAEVYFRDMKLYPLK